MKHLVFPSIKLGGLHLMVCLFWFFLTRQDLHYSEYEELIAGPTGFISKKKKKPGFMPVKHDLRQNNNTFPYSRSRKRKAESLKSLTGILECLLIWFGHKFFCSYCLLCVQHKLPWSMEGNTKITTIYWVPTIHARYSGRALLILTHPLRGRYSKTHFTDDETEALRLAMITDRW